MRGKKRIGVAWVLLLFTYSVLGKGNFTLSGTVYDEQRKSLPGASILLQKVDQKGGITNAKGVYKISHLEEGTYRLTISYVGFESMQDTIQLKSNRIYDATMKSISQTLQEVVIVDNQSEERRKREALHTDIVDNTYLKQERGGSLMKSIERLAGINTIAVGSGQSKPMIRGLGFNRVVVVENGIKHSGQEWGADHGLEIDQYAVDNVEVTKGPASLQYGSDAIGGVINVKQNKIPQEKSIGATLDFTAKSNNELLGTSVSVFGRKKYLFFKVRGTLLSYGDYKVPTDSIDIYSYRAALHKKHLRNTAGKEQNIHIMLGWKRNNFTSKLFFSNVYAKSGFFANAHGLEPRNINSEEQDKSTRDILYPFQQVNHLKVLNENVWRTAKYKIETSIGYQKNFREEWSKYTSHGYMPAVFPENLTFPADLEREFKKDILALNVKGRYFVNPIFSIFSGVNAEYQDNKISGRGFIIPTFTQLSLGIFAIAKHDFSEKSILRYGLRYDYGNLKTEPYKDWYQSPVDPQNPQSLEYLQRAKSLDKKFANISWSIGYNHNFERLSLRVNAGRSFRMPIAKELGANGVNYHRFSYEVGDSDLSPEVSYQLDFGTVYKVNNFAVEFTPFFNYFSNYIYLNPSAQHDRLYGNGHQVFFYTQAEVFRYGAELHTHYNILPELKLSIMGDYVYSEQFSGVKKGYSLPFSPPASVILNAEYKKTKWLFFNDAYLSFDSKFVAEQNNIVPPERKTDSAQIFSIGGGATIYWKTQPIKFFFKVDNLLNTRYFNHTSFYRMINVPEASRNIILNISVPLLRKS